jgi:hypothetical protein
MRHDGVTCGFHGATCDFDPKMPHAFVGLVIEIDATPARDEFARLADELRDLAQDLLS